MDSYCLTTNCDYDQQYTAYYRYDRISIGVSDAGLLARGHREVLPGVPGCVRTAMLPASGMLLPQSTGKERSSRNAPQSQQLVGDQV